MFTIIRAAAARAGSVALPLLAWTAIMLALPFVGQSGRDVAVVGPVHAIAASGGRIVEVRGGVVIARGSEPDFVARLYARGAHLVLEGRVGAGCFPKPQPKAGA